MFHARPQRFTASWEEGPAYLKLRGKLPKFRPPGSPFDKGHITLGSILGSPVSGNPNGPVRTRSNNVNRCPQGHLPALLGINQSNTSPTAPASSVGTYATSWTQGSELANRASTNSRNRTSKQCSEI